MKIYPTPLSIGEEEGFSSESDLFERAQLAEGMTNLLTTVEDPLVVAFDGPWGSGKTTFLKMWAGELRKDGYPVILFDAFANDYVEDAFAALTRELVELAEQLQPRGQEASASLKDNAVRLGAMLLRGTSKVAVRAAARAATAGLVTGKDLKDVAYDLQDEVVDVADAYMEEILTKPKAQKATIDAFRQALAELPAQLSPPEKEETQKPLIYIIDELDRCKPMFALAILERIKHFMFVPNVHFVLGVHMEQLENSVKFSYGSGIDASLYLQKFINFTIFNVDVRDRSNKSALEKYSSFLQRNLSVPRDHGRPLELASETIVRVLDHRGMGLRTLERAQAQLILSLYFTPKNMLLLGPVIGGMTVLKLLDPPLFRKAKRGILNLDDILKFLHLNGDISDYEDHMQWERNWWTYILADELPDELKDFGQSLGRYRMRSRREIAQFTANSIVDRLQT